ncbi:testin [Gymnodraco acuticeps]|uniref:Testin n=1 Tax=Gymnodraco acuticeps TaxID=8218 RepID=A0A6P8SZB6_GYMAC|nr:testin [Gymnodraco acuticeps]
MEIEKEVKKMTLGHEFGAGASCLKCKDKCEGFELHFWRKICRNCKCGLTEHNVQMISEENKKVGKLFEDTKYTGLIAKLKTDGVPSYRGNMVTISMPSSGTAYIVPPSASSSSVVRPPATAGSVQPAGGAAGPAGGAAGPAGGAAGPAGGAAGPAGGSAGPARGAAGSSGGVRPPAASLTPLKANRVPVTVSLASANTVPRDVPMMSVTYEWAPPVANKYLAARYIELLPAEKRPVAGTEGAVYRRQQMARQLPEHDQDPAQCHELSPAEVKQMQQFVRKYKDEALGVADVILPEEMALVRAGGGAGGAHGAGGAGYGPGGVGAGAGGPGAGYGAAAGYGPGNAGPGVGAGFGAGAGGRGAAAPGSAGYAGAPGYAGYAGVPGSAGAPGVPGSAGYAGAPGSAGYAGVPGSAGAPVVPGSAGYAGVPGSAGAPGVPGSAGAMGAPGSQQAGLPQQAFSCNHCQQPMRVGEPAVYAERAGYDKMWHPACFVCCNCSELLVDMIYFWKKGKLYCGRHYGDSEKPRCGGCDELIFSNEYTQAEGQNWHLKHFCCFECDCILAGETYVMENDKPVCQPCYMKSYAVKCSSCQLLVDPEAQRVSYGDFHWHADPQCFKCSGCSKCLVGQRFMAVKNFLFCSVDCKKKIVV